MFVFTENKQCDISERRTCNKNDKWELKINKLRISNMTKAQRYHSNGLIPNGLIWTEWRLLIARDLCREGACSHKLIRITRQQYHVLLISPMYIHSDVLRHTLLIQVHVLLVNDCQNRIKILNVENIRYYFGKLAITVLNK